jgi:malonyl CoA-acyl carrier protein transacylase
MAAALTAPRPPAGPRPTAGWDTEVFVLRGGDRARLRERVATLVRFLDDNPSADLPALAGTLARGLEPGGCRLAVVAASPTDLRAKLARAADRLADPGCRQIRDAAGVYFTSDPLFPQGTLALVFPGEGAQYPNMLADLCGVLPEVEETFAWCDRLAAEAGRPSLRRTLHTPPDATAAEKAAAETELRKLGPSIFGVLVADLAVFRVLQNLTVPVAAMAGHSAGELAALLAAGAVPDGVVMGSQLPGLMDLMQRQEEEAGGPDVALLAVGAGKAAVDEAAAAVAGRAVVVAMDNCPHQCVAVGPTHLVAAVEAVLTEKGFICERLPFRRPYHTPLFEPWMGPFRELFAGAAFARPQTPVYCGTTGRRFPDDPDAIRALAVNHWVSPVEWTRTVEAMYADGVRLFVEAGPRGNLSAFAEDILRGRPFAALPANTPRKSGPTQLNHLVAQLVAHHVPLNLDYLYAGRVAGEVEWEKNPTLQPPPRSGEGGPEGNRDGERLSDVFLPLPASGWGVGGGVLPEPDSAVMTGYLAAMEQFLDVQRAVMEAFLAGRGESDPTVPPVGWLPEDLAGSAPPPSFALVGTIEHHVPGKEIVFRRPLDEREELYAADHTLGGRGVSRVDPRQNGLPVLPMTFSLEAMAEAATLLAPGKVVVAVRTVRLFRWLPFDPEPTALEVRAAVASADAATGVVEVKADVRDLGNSFVADGAAKAACEAVVVLADDYPEPPEPLPFRLTDEQPCKSTVEDLRRNMFHGPLFQMMCTLDRTGREGIEGALDVKPRTGWFRSGSEPRAVLDPVLTDAAMHIIGAWHLEQPDWTGRILLPFEVSRVEYFGPPPPAGSRLLVRGHNEQESARHVRHGLELFGPDGRVWLRMTGAGYWRFYLPFGHVNFFGPKDEYFLSRDWPEAVGEFTERGARSAERKSDSRSALARCYVLEPPADLKQPVLRAAGARVTMTARELIEFGSWKATDAGLTDWLFGRLVAKDAVRASWAGRYGECLFPADIEMTVDKDGRYVATPRGPAGPEPLPPVAVAIADGTVAAFSAFARRVGIALLKLARDANEDDDRRRAARLAVADALRVGPNEIAVEGPDSEGRVRAALPQQLAARFPELPGSLLVQTARRKDAVVATTTCEADPR